MWGMPSARVSQRVNNAKHRIVQLFVDQCGHGNQTKTLGDEVAACGQFLGPEAKSSCAEHRPTRNCRSASRVLADSNDPAASGHWCARLVRFLTRCEEHTEEQKSKVDVTNVVEISEVLYACHLWNILKLMWRRLIKPLADTLLNSIQEDRGWGYFTSGGPVELLPTAYAIRGLASHKYCVDKQAAFLHEKLSCARRSVCQNSRTWMFLFRSPASLLLHFRTSLDRTAPSPPISQHW